MNVAPPSLDSIKADSEPKISDRGGETLANNYLFGICTVILLLLTKSEPVFDGVRFLWFKCVFASTNIIFFSTVPKHSCDKIHRISLSPFAVLVLNGTI